MMINIHTYIDTFGIALFVINMVAIFLRAKASIVKKPVKHFQRFKRWSAFYMQEKLMVWSLYAVLILPLLHPLGILVFSGVLMTLTLVGVIIGVKNVQFNRWVAKIGLLK